VDYVTILQEIDWIREALGAAAVLSGFVAKWKMGSLKISGWVWGFACAAFWIAFAVRIESPTALINNLVFMYLAIRGFRLWKQRGV
jgi:hypothetical protein